MNRCGSGLGCQCVGACTGVLFNGLEYPINDHQHHEWDEWPVLHEDPANRNAETRQFVGKGKNGDDTERIIPILTELVCRRFMVLCTTYVVA